MTSKIFHSKKDISKHLSSYQKSNLPVSAYCKKHSISPSTFYNWQKHNSQDKTGTDSKITGKSFARLTLTSPNPVIYEIVKNDFTIRIPGNFDSSVLRRIVEVLP